jgi:hypothetical protein
MQNREKLRQKGHERILKNEESQEGENDHVLKEGE